LCRVSIVIFAIAPHAGNGKFFEKIENHVVILSGIAGRGCAKTLLPVLVKERCRLGSVSSCGSAPPGFFCMIRRVGNQNISAKMYFLFFCMGRR